MVLIFQMAANWFVFKVSLLLFSISEINSLRNATIRVKLKDNAASKLYTDLLKSIVNVNEQRVETMQKLYKLQDLNAARGLRTKPSSDQDEDMNEILRVVFLTKTPSHTSTEEDDTVITPLTHEGDMKKKDSFDNLTSTNLRMWERCRLSGSRICTAACKEAYRDVCVTYVCRARMRKQFKNACARHCWRAFSD